MYSIINKCITGQTYSLTYCPTLVFINYNFLALSVYSNAPYLYQSPPSLPLIPFYPAPTQYLLTTILEYYFWATIEGSGVTIISKTDS